MEFKVVIGAKDGKSYQKEIKDDRAEALLKKVLGDKISGEELGFSGYEFLLTGGSDKCGFPMRKGIQSARKRVMIGKSVGCSGLSRNNKKQNGMVKRKTVCGERVTNIISQLNLKVVKEGPQPLGGASEEKKEE